MKKLLLIIGVILFIVTIQVTASEQETSAALDLSSEKSKLSYAVGLRIGKDLQQVQDHIDIDVLIHGLSDSIQGKEPQISAADAAEAQNKFIQMVQQIRERRIKEMANANTEQGQKYLDENKAKEGVVTTDSGLQYEVIEQGEGAKPTSSDNVTVHYRGTLTDGTEFDSSYSRGEPATFPVNGVIAGWTEALQLMSVGSKYRLVLPPDLAYGARGAGPVIGPNATLVFDVELLSIGQ